MEFRYVWEQLLEEPAREQNEMDVDTDNMPVSVILYDEFMSAEIRFLNTLDLGTIEYEQPDEASDTTVIFQRTQTSSTGDLRALKPLKAKDFELFQNFVDFSMFFFPNIRPDLYDRWVYLYGVCIIGLSNKWPIVSGFYKLMACTLSVCKKRERWKLVGYRNGDI
jgi:DNA-dependent protein kinase catalytic subunit